MKFSSQIGSTMVIEELKMTDRERDVLSSVVKH